MSEDRIRKGLLYLVIGFVLLSCLPFQFPTAIQKTVEGAESAKLTAPAHEVVLCSRLPEDLTSIVPNRNQLNQTVLKEHNQGRYHAFRFLVLAIAAVIGWYFIVCITIKRFGSHTIDLWQNIYYIHRVDGKKGKCFL